MSKPTPSAEASKGPTDIPNPDLTLIYRTIPFTSTFPALDIDLDIYLPPSPSTSDKGHALVIWFHGGGLLQGNKENLTPHFRRLPRMPYPNGENVAVISPNYRLSPQSPISDVLSDVSTLLAYVRTELNGDLAKAGKGENRIDTSRICLSGGSAGGYLALIGGIRIPKEISDENIGGYRGEEGVKCIAPFYAITDLEDVFWATKTDPVPWMDRHVAKEEAEPHLDPKSAPICTAVSGGPRSILYPYMLQYALFPSLLFMSQFPIKGITPNPKSMGITTRLDLLKGLEDGPSQPPMFFNYCGKDDKVQIMDKTLEALKGYKGKVEIEFRPELDHGFDEDPTEQGEKFRKWLGETLL